MEEKLIFAFVLMPFDPKFNDVYQIGIKEAAAQVGIVAERLDDQIFVEGMLDRIYRQIEAADIVIADMSDKNPNVFYEVGYAHAKDKLCILQTSDSKDIPFDLKHWRHIVYNGSISLLRDELIKSLEWAKKEIDNIRKSLIRLAFKPPNGIGALSRTKYVATASLDYQFDLFNESNKPSPEIIAIYFYTGSQWALKQGDKDCPYTQSDIDRFNYRYFLTPPISRLGKNSWAQLKFSGTRIMANIFHGDEIKTDYTLSGNTILRIVTSEGIFDYEIHINVEVSEVPF